MGSRVLLLEADLRRPTLAGAGAPLLGVIANGFKATRGSYGYSYDYSYTPDKQSPPTPATDATSPNGAASSEETVSSTQS
jgi:Mrp family chromosome partitioning ATPase